jgi:4a-hydroxytetrahydrobiopterin dehydratase
MSTLADRSCKPCEGGVAPLTPAESQKYLAQVSPAWAVSADNKTLQREFKFKDFYRTMSFVNALAHVANIEDHHPDLEVGYSHCRVTFTTHAIRGLSENDFVCAAKLDLIPLS